MAVSTNTAGLDRQIPQELEDAYDRIIAIDSLSHIKILKKLKDSKSQYNSIMAEHILAAEVNSEAPKAAEDEPLLSSKQPSVEKKVLLREHGDQLHLALLKHASTANALQDAIFQAQIQNEVYKHFEEDNEDNQNPQIKSLLKHYSGSLNQMSELSLILKENEQLEKDILQSRIKYRALLESIEEKWKIVIGTKKPTHLMKNPELKLLHEKLSKREERLGLVTFLLQNLISSSGEKWGRDPHIVQIMLLCDIANSQGINSDELLDTLKQLKETREDGSEDSEEVPQAQNAMPYVTSTPL